jgi:solute carrier family 13 (sodium-dependent dicarboxylate transporter), member 2/3/5
MTTDTLPALPPARVAGTATYLLKLLAGPLAAAIVMSLALALSYEGRVVLATFTCVVVWWITQPLPWAVAAMLPFLVFPAAGVMDNAATMRLYGQPIFFWIMGTVLLGYAIEKHGLAQRIALAFLALPGVGTKAHRLTFTYMSMVGLVSMFVSDAATVAMMIPIGMSVVRHVRGLSGTPDDRHTNFGTFITLGTLYAAVAGGTATMIGVPHNGVAISILERVTGRRLGFFEWMIVGVPIFLSLLVISFATLWLLARPELRELPGGEAFLRTERAKLGGLRPNERRVLLVFVVMVILFTLPAVAGLALGDRHAVTAAIDRALPIWVVPPAVLFLLFGIRSASEPGAGLLTWRDAEQQSPWNIMILVAAGVAMTDALAQFGFVEFVGGAVKSLGIGPMLLPYAAAALVSVTTNLISGTATATLYSSIFIPAAAQIGYNPASIAILIANVAIGVVLPWAGATSATAFAGGEIEMHRMVKIGVFVTALFSVVAATIHLALAGIL